ncbi:DUF3219 family protein [Peribacillus glennii]|uniref:DUF3219 family protein n=1 Tax=Peribacillus glennii TaxID=2303991 RepID=A0A372L7W6_9BACI|nr:DUF3219 family protein [Peribacillus glennii]RFU60855.1 DUF3219 family protein [Peribacillus glennii]
MANEVILNGTVLNVTGYKEQIAEGNGAHRISFDFQVKSSEYHAITTLLYEGSFDVKVPERSLEFRGSISNYYTSVTDLYKENEVGSFHLELIEKM